VVNYLSGARCRLFAHGLAATTAKPKPLAAFKSSLVLPFQFLVSAYPGCPGKEASVVVVVLLIEYHLRLG